MKQRWNVTSTICVVLPNGELQERKMEELTKNDRQSFMNIIGRTAFNLAYRSTGFEMQGSDTGLSFK